MSIFEEFNMLSAKYLRVIVILSTVFCFNFVGCQTSPQPVQPEVQKPVVGKLVQPEALPASKAPQAAPSVKGAQLVLENPVFDMGDVVPGSSNQCQFTFKNVGEETLKLENVISTCGCMVPELAKKEYAKGESGVVDVSFHAPTYAGQISKHLYLPSNDLKNPRAELTITGQVAIKVVVDPNSPIKLILNRENAGMVPLKVRSIDGNPFAITDFKSTGQAITVDFDPSKKAAEHILMPKVDITKLQEINSGVIQIEVDHPGAKEVLVSYSAVPMYELRPPRVALQNVEIGSINRREVWVINNYGQAFEIESTDSKAGYMKVVNQKKEGINIGLDVEITIPKQEGPVPRRYITDQLTIKIKDGPSLTVYCSGWYKL